MYNIEEYDTEKTKVLKYALYKKRTIREIKTKFRSVIKEEMLEDILQELEQNGYIGDEMYIKKAVNEYIALKNLSIKELKYKLSSKGIQSSLIEDYISENIEELEEYERKSAENITIKRAVNMDENDIKSYLMKKGYKEENIKEAIAKIEE